MKFFIVLLGVGIAVAAPANNNQQLLDKLKDFFNDKDKYDATIDVIHNYRFEDHLNPIGPHLLIAISDKDADKACHVIVVDPGWESALKDDTLVYQITDEIYELLFNHKADETQKTMRELYRHYGDNEQTRECFRHRVYEMNYTPSFMIGSTVASKV